MRRARFVLVASVAAFVAAILLTSASPTAEEAKPKPFGIDKRTLWTTSHVAGAPDPPSPFTSERAFPHLKFDRPLDLQCAPDGKHWFMSEEDGRVLTFAADEQTRQAVTVLDLRKPGAMRRMWSMTFHPKFDENGFVYVCYYEGKPAPARCRIVRFRTDPKNPVKTEPESEYIVCEWWAGEDHWGGCLQFGPDGYLYFSVGDGHGYADGNESGQDLSDFQASIHRIDVDRPDKGKSYGVPKDNPFVDLKGARPEIWAYGTRNVWKMSFDRKTGELWAGDVGQDLWESVYRIEKGGNYGWSVVEGTHPFRPERKLGPTPILKPVIEHEHSESRSLTGGYAYRGKKFPELVGAYVYGDYETGKIWALRYDGTKVTWHQELVDTPLKLVAFGQAGDGELFLLDYARGTIHRLERNPPPDPAKQPPPFPRRLSETGLFQSTKDHAPDPALIPYSVNSPLWSDRANKDRFIALLGDSKIEYNPFGGWKFPDGAVLVKTFSLDMERGNPASRKRLETRLLHNEQDHWRGYTYIWNNDQTDADLHDAKALDRVYSIKDSTAPGGRRDQTWHFPSRAECTLCHTMPVGFVLGLNTLQMNKDHDYGRVTDNQLRTLHHLGVFTLPILGAAKSAADLPRMPDPLDATAPLNDRARSYLHANCSHCHVQWGGGNALFQLTYQLKLDQTRIVDVPPQHGNHGLDGAKILLPGDPTRSLLHHRMTRPKEARMPPVASSVVDEEGAKLIEEWIKSLRK